jgi:hypothetical protein
VARQVLDTLEKVPPGLRRMVYRGLLVVSLFFEISQRSLPAFIGFIAQAPERIAQEITSGVRQMVENLGRALSEVLGLNPSTVSIKLVGYFVVLLTLVALCYLFRPRARKVMYV